jgi:hypothetical protein
VTLAVAVHRGIVLPVYQFHYLLRAHFRASEIKSADAAAMLTRQRTNSLMRDASIC